MRVLREPHPDRHATPFPRQAGEIRWSPTKSLLFTGCTLATLVWGWSTATPGNLAVFAATTATCLCLGHSVGLHRGLIHGTFAMGPRTARVLLWLATLTGIGPVLRLMDVHDRRDLWQNLPAAPAYYTYRHGLLTDFWWYLHCDHHPPADQPQVQTFTRARWAHDPVFRWLDRTWLLQQLPVAVVLFALFGWGGVVWGCCARIAASMGGHWLVNFIAHRHGTLRWRMPGAGEEGRNSLLFGALSMGEGWHNNHHAFPHSARFGMHWWELDPGWWAVCALEGLGLVWAVQTWETQAPREGTIEASPHLVVDAPAG